MNKKALSGTVNMMLLIGITLAAGIIVWGIINSLVTEKLEDAGNCYGIQGKINFNQEYICYNASEDTLRFSINLEDIIPEQILISAQTENASTVIRIPRNPEIVENLISYPDDRTGNVSLPGKEAGKSYTFSGIDYKPTKLQMAPVISGKPCEIADTFSPIPNCN